MWTVACVSFPSLLSSPVLEMWVVMMVSYSSLFDSASPLSSPVVVVVAMVVRSCCTLHPLQSLRRWW